MATKALEKVEEQLYCSLCLHTYTAPKLLQCFHTYCQQCLVPLVVRDQQGKLGLTCPTCRQLTPIPVDRGVAGLQSAFYINRLLEIRESLQKPAVTPCPEGVGYCSVHEGKKLVLYCVSCKDLICTKCALKGGKHEDHDYEELDQTFEKYKKEIAPSLEPMEKKALTFKQALEAVKELRTPAFSIDGRSKPRDVAIGPQGEIVMTEWRGGCVSVFSPGGGKIRSIGTRGSGQGQLKHPRGVAVDGEGNILVADGGNNRIQKFTPEGQFLAIQGTRDGTLPISSPTGIAFSTSKDMIYVVEKDSHRVQVLNSDFSFFCLFGERGSGEGQFYDPQGVACNSTGNVYVVDRGNHNIQVFTFEGNFLRAFERKTSKPMDPAGVAVDARGMVYVSEWENMRVSIFTSEGQFVSSFGRKGRGPGEFRGASGLAVDVHSSIVYVCDWGNNRLQVFQS